MVTIPGTLKVAPKFSRPDVVRTIHNEQKYLTKHLHLTGMEGQLSFRLEVQRRIN
jgi:hypothetical protein